MRKQLKYKLEEFYDKRVFAETDQRKRMVDFEVVGYLEKRTENNAEFMKYYNYYTELQKGGEK